MAFVVIYDACVLYPAPLRDLLVRVAQTGLVRARWTSQILDECFRSILAQRPEFTLKNPPMTLGAVLDTLRSNGLVQAVAKLREMYGESVGGAGRAE